MCGLATVAVGLLIYGVEMLVKPKPVEQLQTDGD
jgi:hypothetical protein